MPALTWDNTGERFYETGVDRGVLYTYDSTTKLYGTGVAWNGLTAITEAPSGAEPTPQYADNIKYLNLMSAEEFGFTIEAFTYPDEFELCDGTASPLAGLTVAQQARRTFGLSYRSLIGNDVDAQDHGYKIHLIYGALASPSEKSRTTVNDTPEAMTFSWTATTTPVALPADLKMRPTAHIVADSTKMTAANLASLEAVLYGDELESAALPLPGELITLLGTTP
jgi:hypothetical protein